MGVQITYNGNVYTIPEDDETGWEDLTDFLVAVALSAATTNGAFFSARTATSTPQTLQASDAFLGINVPAASIVNVPSGIVKQIYGVFDISGAASANPITVTPSGGQLIGGESTYVINSDRGGVIFQFNGQQWVILAEYTDVFKRAKRVQNNVTNASFVESAITQAGTPAAAANLTSASASFGGSNHIACSVALDSGESFIVHGSVASAALTVFADTAGIFLESDAGTGVVVTKSAASSVLVFKNRMGSSKNIEIKALTNRLSAVTAWA